MKIKNPKDFLAGLMFIVFGLFFVIGARNYQLGSAARMGPAYFPTLLGTPMMEENLRSALLLSRGDPTVLFARPISAGFLIAAIILPGIVLAPTVRKKREEVFEED